MSHIRYEIRLDDPALHYLAVTLTIDKPALIGQKLSLPSWIPGSYLIRDFAGHIVNISAIDKNGPIALEKCDKSTWVLADCHGPVEISYTVYAWDLSVRGAHADETHVFFNGTAVFLMVHGQEHNAVQINLARPKHDVRKTWRVATTLNRLSGGPFDFGEFSAEDYDELIDNPVEMGEFSNYRFMIEDVVHEIILTGQHDLDADRLCQDLQKICMAQKKMMREPLPFKRYLFLVHVLNQGYGGLEHKRCCSLHCSKHELPTTRTSRDDKDYINFLNLCSHEYFHLWNVKRLKPREFVPYDLSKETPTTLLWVFEGFTTYYQDLFLVRAGVIDESTYYRLLSELLTALLRTPGRMQQSVEQSSFDAWVKLYKANANTVNASISYYVKGAVIALALDLSLRSQGEQPASLDDVMRLLWQKYGQSEIGVSKEEILAAIEAVSNESVAAQIKQWITTTEDIDLAPLFKAFGINYRLRWPIGYDDRGGANPQELNERPFSLGAKLERVAMGLRCRFVYVGGSAANAGLSSGDIIIAINGSRVQDNWQRQLARFDVGDTITVHYFRLDELYNKSISLQGANLDTVVVEVDDTASDCTEKRQAWLLNDHVSY